MHATFLILPIRQESLVSYWIQAILEKVLSTSYLLDDGVLKSMSTELLLLTTRSEHELMAANTAISPTNNRIRNCFDIISLRLVDYFDVLIPLV